MDLDELRSIASGLAAAIAPRESLIELLGLVARTAQGRVAIVLVSKDELHTLSNGVEAGDDGVVQLSERAGLASSGPVADAIRDWEGAARPFLSDDGSRLILPQASGGIVVVDPGCGITALPAQVTYLRVLADLARGTVLMAARTAEAARRAEALEATRHRLREQAILLRDLAVIDDLTAIYNRRFFDCRLTYEFDRFHRYKHPLALALLDVDHFKRVNDVHGHQVGDAVLRHLAQLGQAAIRRVDLFARFGGEEFAILLPSTDGAGAMEAAERLRLTVMNSPALVDGLSIPITISIGVGWVSAGFEGDQQGLIRAADQALYRAKRLGRNQVVLTDEDQDG